MIALDSIQWALFGALLLTGLAGSLHCIGMCGPLLIGLSRQLPKGRSLTRDTFAYHAGRIWVYALLGLIAGSFGQQLEQRWGGRHLFAGVFAVVVILNAILLLKKTPSRLELWIANGYATLFRSVQRATQTQSPNGALGRFLIGAVMGLTPCGMVWMALIPASALGHPLLSALGMVSFGLGTVPALTAVVIANRLVADRFRKHSRTLAAVAMLIAGMMLLSRALPIGSHEGSHCCAKPTVQASAQSPQE